MYGGEDERGSQAEAAHGGVARQVAEVSFAVHNILASIADEEEERFATILTPTPGRSRWTPDEAKRRTGRQVAKPVTPLEKISAIHTLAKNAARAVRSPSQSRRWRRSAPSTPSPRTRRSPRR
jgi:(p)ppGpp synthase/HD superfamily hydrolase